MCSNVKVYSRATWGAMNPTSVSTISTPVNLFFIHHTTGIRCYDFSTCAAKVRNIQNHHMTTNGMYMYSLQIIFSRIDCKSIFPLKNFAGLIFFLNKNLDTDVSIFKVLVLYKINQSYSFIHSCKVSVTVKNILRNRNIKVGQTSDTVSLWVRMAQSMRAAAGRTSEPIPLVTIVSPSLRL